MIERKGRRKSGWEGGDRLQQALTYWSGNEDAVERLVDALSNRELLVHRTTVQRYLSNKIAPSIDFLRTAADVLGVRFAWLAANDGEMTEALETERIRRRLERGNLSGIWKEIEDREEGLLQQVLPAGTPSERWALKRFRQKLDESSIGSEGVPWFDTRNREALIAGAAAFVMAAREARHRAVEAADAMLEVDSTGRLLVQNPDSPAWEGEWLEDVLSCYSRCVRGLGAPSTWVRPVDHNLEED